MIMRQSGRFDHSHGFIAFRLNGHLFGQRFCRSAICNGIPLAQLFPMIVHSNRTGVTDAAHDVVDGRRWRQHMLCHGGRLLHAVFVLDYHFVGRNLVVRRGVDNGSKHETKKSNSGPCANLLSLDMCFPFTLSLALNCIHTFYRRRKKNRKHMQL